MMPQRFRKLKSQRSGAVLVEFALVLPVILFTFASLVEVSRVLLLKHTADTAAYEGARSGMVPGATAADASNMAKSLLTVAGLKGATVEITPKVVDDETPMITVAVAIPLSENFWITPMLFKDYTARSEVSLFCERPPVVQLVGVPEMKIKGSKGGKDKGGL